MSSFLQNIHRRRGCLDRAAFYPGRDHQEYRKADERERDHTIDEFNIEPRRRLQIRVDHRHESPERYHQDKKHRYQCEGDSAASLV